MVRLFKLNIGRKNETKKQKHRDSEKGIERDSVRVGMSEWERDREQVSNSNIASMKDSEKKKSQWQTKWVGRDLEIQQDIYRDRDTNSTREWKKKRVRVKDRNNNGKIAESRHLLVRFLNFQLKQEMVINKWNYKNLSDHI